MFIGEIISCEKFVDESWGWGRSCSNSSGMFPFNYTCQLSCEKLSSIICIDNFVTNVPGELNLAVHDVVTVTSKLNDGWARGFKVGRNFESGEFPLAFTKPFQIKQTQDGAVRCATKQATGIVKNETMEQSGNNEDTSHGKSNVNSFVDFPSSKYDRTDLSKHNEVANLQNLNSYSDHQPFTGKISCFYSFSSCICFITIINWKSIMCFIKD